MPTRIEAIIVELEAGGRQTAAFFGSLTAEQLAMPVYADGAEWTVRQVLAHLATIERTMPVLFSDILAGGPGDKGEFDIERYNRSQPRKLDDLPFEEVIARFEAVRAATVEAVRGMAEADLDRPGRHPFLGEGTLERFVRWAGEHAAIHEADVRRALGMALS